MRRLISTLCAAVMLYSVWINPSYGQANKTNDVANQTQNRSALPDQKLRLAQQLRDLDARIEIIEEHTEDIRARLKEGQLEGKARYELESEFTHLLGEKDTLITQLSTSSARLEAIEESENPKTIETRLFKLIPDYSPSSFVFRSQSRSVA